MVPQIARESLPHEPARAMKTIQKASLLLLLAALVAGGLWRTQRTVAGALGLGGWSDALRQWEVCQYVKARINPYELAFRVLRDTYGPATGPNRVLLREQRIYSISSARWNESTPGILPGHPPPEATYPPSTMSMLVPTIGFLPKSVLLPAYTTANVIFLLLLISLLADWFHKETRLSKPLSLAMVAALCLLWPPLQYVIQNGQAGLLALLCALGAMVLLDRSPVMAGVLFMLSLVKPSMVLLYLFIPLIRWKWKPLWTTFFLGIVLTLLPSLWFREWPWVLISQWMDLCRYVLQGAFTLQEVLNAIAWENTPQGLLVVLLLWGAVLAWCLGHRRARWEELFAFLSLANLSWTYHERHDFVLVVFLLVLFAAKLIQPGRRTGALLGLGLCLILGLALSEQFYVPATSGAHVLRWAGRVALVGLWGVTAAAVRNSHREPRAALLQPSTP
jgi:hypothetical protein